MGLDRLFIEFSITVRSRAFIVLRGKALFIRRSDCHYGETTGWVGSQDALYRTIFRSTLYLKLIEMLRCKWSACLKTRYFLLLLLLCKGWIKSYALYRIYVINLGAPCYFNI